MNVYFVEKFSEGDKDQQLDAMRKYFKFTTLEEADAIYCASIVMMAQAKAAKLNTGKPLAVYCWDYYKWAHEGKNHSWNWRDYADFLKIADIIFVPSFAQKIRLKELLGLDSIVVKTGILTYEHEVTDGGFILDPLRYYPLPQEKWAEQAAAELGIPIIHSEHQYNEEEFRKLVASCAFMTCAVEEASTGGLTLSEGLWLGKPSLVSYSHYNGAKDYLGKFLFTFEGDYETFKNQMAWMWDHRPVFDKKEIKEIRDYMTKELSFDNMAKGLYEGIKKITHSY